MASTYEVKSKTKNIIYHMVISTNRKMCLYVLTYFVDYLLLLYMFLSQCGNFPP